jgi:hypothetical protein
MIETNLPVTPGVFCRVEGSDPLETARRAEKTNGGDCRARGSPPARDRLQSFDLPAERCVA